MFSYTKNDATNDIVVTLNSEESLTAMDGETAFIIDELTEIQPDPWYFLRYPARFQFDPNTSLPILRVT